MVAFMLFLNILIPAMPKKIGNNFICLMMHFSLRPLLALFEGNKPKQADQQIKLFPRTSVAVGVLISSVFVTI